MNDEHPIKKNLNPKHTFIVLFVLAVLSYVFYAIDPLTNFDRISIIEDTAVETDTNLWGKVTAFFKRDEDVPTSEKPKNLTKEVVREESTTIDVVKNVSPSVVSVIVKRVGYDIFTGPYASEDGIGTGFIVDSTGLIVTNSHVVNDPSGEYSVVLSDGSTYDVTKVNLDETTDLAIIEIVAKDLPEVSLGDSSSLNVGQTAIAIGNALGRFSNTVTVGVVSGVARELSASGGSGGLKTYEDVIQTDAALNPGNSGGPLLNSAGQVIGINVATTYGADNISFAIPVNTLKPILEGFFKEGRIVRPYIGISYSIISPEIAKIRDFPEGAFVSRVVPGSPADVAGIERGDVVTKFDGKDVDENSSLGNMVRTKVVGDKVEVEIDRSGKKSTLELILQEAPQNLQ